MSTTEDSETSTFVRLARTLMDPVGTQPTLDAIVDQATHLVPCRWAAALVAERITSTPATLAATTDDPLTRVIARIAAEAGTSPGWQAFECGEVRHVPDLRAETRFASYPTQMSALTPVRSVLSVPLRDRHRVTGVLTMYSDQVHHFGEDERERAVFLASHAGVALTAATAEDQAVNLQRALDSSRTISAAVGILVERHKLREEQGFDVLRVASQLTNRRLAELAEQLVATGELPREAAAVERLSRRLRTTPPT